MCDHCDNIVTNMSARSGREMKALFAAFLTHFIADHPTDDETAWDSEKLYTALAPFLDNAEIAKLLPSAPAAMQLFLYGAMAALDMVGEQIDRSYIMVLNETITDVSVVVDALKA